MVYPEAFFAGLIWVCLFGLVIVYAFQLWVFYSDWRATRKGAK